MAPTTVVRGIDFLIFANTGTDANPLWTAVGGQQGATLTEERDSIETTNKNSDNTSREYDYGPYGWSIEAEGVYVPNDAAWAVLKNCIRNAIKCKVRIKEAGVYSLEGTVLVTSTETDAPYDDATTYSLELQGSGPLTPNPA
jgi:TP901-1 family phage major tail protein